MVVRLLHWSDVVLVGFGWKLVCLVVRVMVVTVLFQSFPYGRVLVGGARKMLVGVKEVLGRP